MTILSIVNLTKIYGRADTKMIALDHLNLSVSQGEFVSVVGPSGSGKSTFLHMLGGGDKPTEGHVYIDGNDLTTMNETELAIFRRRKVGLIYQSYNLIPTLTVEKNIMLPMLLDGEPPDQSEFNRLVQMLGLSNRLNHYPNQLSGGQKQRVAIGRSLMYRPSIILADEPTGNLDSENTETILELLKQANRDYQQTILMITHDDEIAQSAGRKIKIVDGKIVSDKVMTS